MYCILWNGVFTIINFLPAKLHALFLPTIFPDDSSSDGVFPATTNWSGSNSFPFSMQSSINSMETTGMPHF